MIIALKFLVAALLAACWYVFDGSQEMALAIFVFVFAVLLFRSNAQKSLQERDDFKEKVKFAKERELRIEERRILEQKDAKIKAQSKK